VASSFVKKEETWRIELDPSCTSMRRWRGPAPPLCLGTDVSDAELAFVIGNQMGLGAGLGHAADNMLGGTVLGRRAVADLLGVETMRLAGFDAEAEQLAAALEHESRRRAKGLDLGRYYPEGDDPPGFWVWQELAKRYGADILKRFAQAIPKKFNWSAAPGQAFTALDLALHFLGKAAQTDLYGWFASLGATVHPLPRARFGSAAFKQQVGRSLLRRLKDRDATASERMDACEALVARQESEKRSLRYAAQQLKLRAPAARLVGAAWLVRIRDRRAYACLWQLAERNDDPTLAAIAALLLAETGVRKAAGRLVRLAQTLDHRFQLAAGRRLARLGHPEASRFTLAGIRRADGRKAARLDVRHEGEVRVFPIVDGHRVANVFSGEEPGHMPGNTHVSMFFVHWVHAARKFRRRGLTRLAMEQTFKQVRDLGYSCAGLDTGTRNPAHALYRSFGFVDTGVGRQLTHNLEHEAPRTRLKGVTVRLYRPGDEVAMARLFNTCHGDRLNVARRRPARIVGGSVALLAHRGRKLAGYVTVGRHLEHATICELAVAPGDKREGIAAVLMGALHRRLRKQGAKRITVYHAGTSLQPLLGPLGYAERLTGGVDMFALLDLPKFLDEITPLLERRLRKIDWSGTIAICGEEHRAALTIRDGRVAVRRRLPARADITLAGADATITRMVVGRCTPYEPYLQLDLKISPSLGLQARGLLETLFPRVET